MAGNLVWRTTAGQQICSSYDVLNRTTATKYYTGSYSSFDAVPSGAYVANNPPVSYTYHNIS